MCHHLTQTSKDLPEDSKTVDNLLRSLRKYYNEVKTRRQLNLNVPAGFRQRNDLQKTFHEFVPPSSKAASSILPGDPALPIELSSVILSFTPSDEQSPSDQPSVSNVSRKFASGEIKDQISPLNLIRFYYLFYFS